MPSDVLSLPSFDKTTCDQMKKSLLECGTVITATQPATMPDHIICDVHVRSLPTSCLSLLTL